MNLWNTEETFKPSDFLESAHPIGLERAILEQLNSRCLIVWLSLDDESTSRVTFACFFVDRLRFEPRFQPTWRFWYVTFNCVQVLARNSTRQVMATISSKLTTRKASILTNKIRILTDNNKSSNSSIPITDSNFSSPSIKVDRSSIRI